MWRCGDIQAGICLQFRERQRESWITILFPCREPGYPGIFHNVVHLLYCSHSAAFTSPSPNSSKLHNHSRPTLASYIKLHRSSHLSNLSEISISHLLCFPPNFPTCGVCSSWPPSWELQLRLKLHYNHGPLMMNVLDIKQTMLTSRVLL